MGNNLAFEFLHELDGIAEIADLGMKLGGSGVIGRIADGKQSAERNVFGLITSFPVSFLCSSYSYLKLFTFKPSKPIPLGYFL